MPTKKKKHNMLIISPSSEIAQSFLDNLDTNLNVYSISRRNFFHKSIKKNYIINSSDNLSNNKLRRYFGSIKFSYFISFIGDQKIEKKSLNEIKNKKILQIFNTNSIFPVKIVYCLINNNNFKAAAKIIFFSSRSGSITERGTKKHHSKKGNNIYRASKALLNSFVKNLAFQNKNTKKIIIAYDPGWVMTKSSGGGNISLSKSTKDLSLIIKKIGKKHSGKFLNNKFYEIKW
ncbi:hypothetical protein HIMB114_00008970 [alpha proteobacterium HIMB114]|nr:hypothetical protein HIMB114_00008970 [alpha proteobacterium HIMB114]